MYLYCRKFSVITKFLMWSVNDSKTKGETTVKNKRGNYSKTKVCFGREDCKSGKVNKPRTIPRGRDDWDGLESRRACHFASEAIHWAQPSIFSICGFSRFWPKIFKTPCVPDGCIYGSTVLGREDQVSKVSFDIILSEKKFRKNFQIFTAKS